MTAFSPEWHALGREAELAGEQLALGVMALGRANHAQQGLYTQAFFALSIGFERRGKLILVADHAIENHRSWLTDNELKTVGHDISALFAAAEAIALKHPTDDSWTLRPTLPIHSAIVACLSEFAKSTRYYNLAFLSSGKAARKSDPIESWWTEVGMRILEQHYSDRQRAKDAAQGKMMSALLAPHTHVIHHEEAGHTISSIEAMMVHSGATRVVQKYGRLYVMQLVRWFSMIMIKLAQKGAYEHRIEALLGLEEPFLMFCNEDRYLRERKTWSICRP